MSFENHPLENLINIAAAGGGFHLSVQMRPYEDLVTIAAAAGTSGARIVFSGLRMMPIDRLINIAAAGKGNVTLEE